MEIPIPILILFAGLYFINLLGFAFWLGKLSNRVTDLEKRDCRIDEMNKKLDVIAVDVAVIKTEMNYLKGLGG
jgi:hypothetical protein